MSVAIDKETRETLTWSATVSNKMNTYRALTIDEIKAKAQECKGRDDEIKRGVPADSTARRLNLGLFEWLHKEIEYPDGELICDVAKGMDIFGEAPYPVTYEIKRPSQR